MIENRKYIIQFFILIVAITYVFKLLHIQVIDDSYKLAAEDNVVNREVEYPYRGLIFDRNNELIVINNPIYDLMLVPREMDVKDTTKFCGCAASATPRGRRRRPPCRRARAPRS